MGDEHNITRVQPEEDISEFVIWYKNQISFMKSGPFHELQVYIDGYQNLTKVYLLMSKACAGDPGVASDPQVLIPILKALTDEVKSWMGRK